MAEAVIFRRRKERPDGSVLVWFEYAPIVGGRPAPRSDHSFRTEEAAKEAAVRDGYDVDSEIIDY
jgi:hypothetical protein